MALNTFTNIYTGGQLAAGAPSYRKIPVGDSVGITFRNYSPYWFIATDDLSNPNPLVYIEPWSQTDHPLKDIDILYIVEQPQMGTVTTTVASLNDNQSLSYLCAYSGTVLPKVSRYLQSIQMVQTDSNGNLIPFNGDVNITNSNINATISGNVDASITSSSVTLDANITNANIDTNVLNEQLQIGAGYVPYVSISVPSGTTSQLTGSLTVLPQGDVVMLANSKFAFTSEQGYDYNFNFQRIVYQNSQQLPIDLSVSSSASPTIHDVTPFSPANNPDPWISLLSNGYSLGNFNMVVVGITPVSTVSTDDVVVVYMVVEGQGTNIAKQDVSLDVTNVFGTATVNEQPVGYTTPLPSAAWPYTAISADGTATTANTAIFSASDYAFPPENGFLIISIAVSAATTLSMSYNNGTDYYLLNGGAELQPGILYEFMAHYDSSDTYINFETGSSVTLNKFRVWWVTGT